MKMSLCNTFRFFAVSTAIVLSIVGSPVPGFVDRQESITTKEINHDLEQRGSLTVELKNEDKRPIYINSLKLNDVKDDTNPLDSDETKKNLNTNSHQTIKSTVITARDIGAKDIEKTTSIPLQLITQPILSTMTLNVTLVSQQAEAILNKSSEDDKINPVKNSATIEKKTLDVMAQNNNTINENKTEVKTYGSITTELEHSTQVTLLDVKNESAVNMGRETEIFSPFTHTAPILANSAKSIKLSSLTTTGGTIPTWKKYTIIERKRVSATIDEVTTARDPSTGKVHNVVSAMPQELTTVTEKSELMLKSESAQGRISLQDAITSDIPSLEKLKSDLLSFPKFTSKSDSELSKQLFTTEQSITETDMSTFLTTTFTSTFHSESPNTVSSKRAGYLDLSGKNSTVKDGISLENNSTESVQSPFDAEISDTQDESLDDKIDRRMDAQSQLVEDAIKEELMKEEMLNDKEEISKRHREEEKQIKSDMPDLPYIDNSNRTQFDNKLVQPPHTVPDEHLSVKPINSDKAKNTILYPVNPNYKPLKKIEVQPAKPFVRDPDDNSWRNESLSSLGIVFKPKNSSKPFTQVLKNKTETEWNNLLDREIKKEIPDLRVRLEQIAQKRKSKKKKIHSDGSVLYTDYEENSSSEESTSTPQDKVPNFGAVSTSDVSTSSISIVTPIQKSVSTSTILAIGANDVSALTTIAPPTEETKTTPKEEPTKVTFLKRPKMFNLFDYYETNDDEDIADYLSMAKIDLKKYTVPLHTTFSPYTPPPLSVLYTHPMSQYTPERKGTVQYFPPRTTNRPRKNKNNNISDKINALALTDSPKHVLPISYHKLTTPYESNVYYTNGPAMRPKGESVPKNFDQSLYLTTPPPTTMSDEEIGVISNDGGYNRPDYVIKHYKDYVNEADPDRSKHREYFFTNSPAHDVTIADFIKPTPIKDKMTATEDYDYESEFRKDLLDRFVANFNEKSNRFKSDFPVVYNNSIVHGPSYDEKEVAMSRAYFKRPYSGQDYKHIARDSYDPSCDNVTVELSPAYELHYYVPEQEEKQEVEAKPIHLPVGYRL